MLQDGIDAGIDDLVAVAFGVPAAQFAQLFRDADLESTLYRFVENLAFQPVGKVALAGGETAPPRRAHSDNPCRSRAPS